MRFKQYLKEAKQVGNLYHFTTLGRLNLILKDDVLKISPHILHKDFPFNVVSLTRDKDFYKRGERFIKGTEIRLTLDGNKLSNNFKIRPFAIPGMKHGDEAEEIISKNIKNISKYIKSIDIIDKEQYENKWLNNEKFQKRIRNIKLNFINN